MPRSDLINRPNQENKPEGNDPELLLEGEDTLIPEAKDPFGKIQPPSDVAPQVTVLQGLGNANYPSQNMRDRLADLRQEERGTVIILDEQLGTACYQDREWGNIYGNLISRPDGERYFAAQNSVVRALPEEIGANSIILSGALIEDTVTIGADTVVGVGAQLRGHLAIGSSCDIGSGARVDGGHLENQQASIDDRTLVGAQVRLGPGNDPSDFSLNIGSDCSIGPRSSLRGGSEIGSNVVIGSDCALERVTIADNVHIGKHSTLIGSSTETCMVNQNLPPYSFFSE